MDSRPESESFQTQPVFFLNRAERVFSCLGNGIVGTGLVLSVFLIDPLAYQNFREPKMVAILWIGGMLLTLWGSWNLARTLRGKRLLLPPSPFWALAIPATLALGCLGNDFFSSRFDTESARGLPLVLEYHLHVLLPAAACFIVVGFCCHLFGREASCRRLGFLVLLVLFAESVLVVLEMVRNRTGFSIDPLAGLGPIETSGQILKQPVFGTIGNPNFLAGYFSIALPTALGWTLGCRRPAARCFGFLVFLLGLVLLVATRSKGALLAVSTGLLHLGIVAVWMKRFPGSVELENRRGLKAVFISIVVFVLLASTAGFLLADVSKPAGERSYIERWKETFLLKGDSLSVRALLAVTGFGMWQEHPWTGWGPGSFKIRFLPSLKEKIEEGGSESLGSRITRLHSLRANHVHNEYLQTLVEWGIAGFLFFELFGVWCEIKALQFLGVSGTSRAFWTRLGCLSGIWSGLGGGWFDLPFHRPAQAFLMAVLLSASLSRPVPPMTLPAPARAGVPARTLFSILLLVFGIGFLHESSLKYSALRNAFWGRMAVDGKIPGANPGKTLEAIRKAIMQVPGEGDYSVLLARYFLFAEGSPNKAIAELRKAALISDHPGIPILEARAQIEKGNRTAAASLLSFVQALDPDAPGLHYLKGRVFEAEGKIEKAVRSYRAEIDRWERSGGTPDTDIGHACLRLAVLSEEELEDFDRAVEYYKAFAEFQGPVARGYPLAQMRLAALYRNRLHDPQRALLWYRKAVEILERTGDGEEAAKIREEIQKLENHDPEDGKRTDP